MLVLAGPIGAGKTQLTHLLSQQLGTQAFEEPVTDNPVLPLFYKGNEEAEMRRQAGEKDATNHYAFLLQIYFLNQRFAMIKKAMQDDNNVLDRSIYEDQLFMKMNTDMGNAKPEEYEIYKHLLNNMMEELPYAAHKKSPDLMIYLKVDYPTMISRIAHRGRAYEQVDSDPTLEEYYKRLLRYYEDWERRYDASPMITIDGTKYDFVNSDSDREHVLNTIYGTLHDMGNIDNDELKRLMMLNQVD
ncbi:deoxynucleoside kinase [Alloscardovia venturai]|uniref:Deoxynucleoside kinase n=1 Tax=Alloscardovia venturai TaxID=1769421 RepID=A0ABW2Y209_9BIFI